MQISCGLSWWIEKDLESTPTEVLTGENEGYAMLEAFSKDIGISLLRVTNIDKLLKGLSKRL